MVRQETPRTLPGRGERLTTKNRAQHFRDERFEKTDHLPWLYPSCLHPPRRMATYSTFSIPVNFPLNFSLCDS